MILNLLSYFNLQSTTAAIVQPNQAGPSRRAVLVEESSVRELRLQAERQLRNSESRLRECDATVRTVRRQFEEAKTTFRRRLATALSARHKAINARNEAKKFVNHFKNLESQK